MMALRVLRRHLRRLVGAGIPFIGLRRTFLIASEVRQLQMLGMPVVDFLVDRALGAAVDAIMAESCWRQMLPPQSLAEELAFGHRRVIVSPDGESIVLQRTLTGPAGSLDAPMISADLRQMDLAGVDAAVTGPTLHLLQLLQAGTMLWHQERLRWVAEAMVIMKNYVQELDSDLLASAGSRLGLQYAADRARCFMEEALEEDVSFLREASMRMRVRYAKVPSSPFPGLRHPAQWRLRDRWRAILIIWWRERREDRVVGTLRVLACLIYASAKRILLQRAGRA